MEKMFQNVDNYKNQQLKIFQLNSEFFIYLAQKKVLKFILKFMRFSVYNSSDLFISSSTTCNNRESMSVRFLEDFNFL